MKRIIVVIIMFCFYNSARAQSIEILDEKHGFRGLKLGSLISDYPGLVQKNSDNSDLFTLRYVGIPYTGYGDYYLSKPNDLYRSLQNTEILKIYVQSFEGKIEDIRLYLVLTPSLLEYFKLAFGEPNYHDCKCIDRPKDMQMYAWVGEKVSLHIMGIPGTPLAFAVFADRGLSMNRSYEEAQKRQQEKEKRRNDAMNDF